MTLMRARYLLTGLGKSRHGPKFCFSKSKNVAETAKRPMTSFHLRYALLLVYASTVVSTYKNTTAMLEESWKKVVHVGKE